MNVSYVTIACALGFVGVALGAFGAHALATVVSPDRLATWSTAVDYHLFHTLVILALSGLFRDKHSLWLTRALNAFVVGIFVFSGSLYALVITDVSVLGAITPVGGLFLLLGWICAFGATRELIEND